MTSRCDITRVFWDPDTVCKGESVAVCVIRAVTTSLSLSLPALERPANVYNAPHENV
jgi:hypothetical protein